jgi:hypothetical protein
MQAATAQAIARRSPRLTAPDQQFSHRPALPRWPFMTMFVLFPIWWILGLAESAWTVLAVAMLFYLVRRRRIEVPRGFGLWLLFLVWMCCSVIEMDSAGRLLGFLYRASLYFTITVIFLYVYNARKSLTPRYIAGVLTAFWLVIVLGGYVGVFFPLLSINTPLYYLLPKSLLSNELVSEMAVRRVTQFDPSSYVQNDPRPSAPFLYTNGWGNAYSMLMPVVVAYMSMVRRQRRFWWLVVAIPVSLVPALLTLDRGMLLGLGVAIAYVAVRLLIKGRIRALLGILVLVVVVGAGISVFAVDQRIASRVDTSSTNQVRVSLYQETVERTLASPVFGYGAPRPSETAGSPSVGTQGQLWQVIFSFGFPGAALFMGWLIWAYFRSLRPWDPLSVASNTAILVAFVESFYYGLLTTGLALVMIAAAVTMRPTDELFEEKSLR